MIFAANLESHTVDHLVDQLISDPHFRVNLVVVFGIKSGYLELDLAGYSEILPFLELKSRLLVVIADEYGWGDFAQLIIQFLGVYISPSAGDSQEDEADRAKNVTVQVSPKFFWSGSDTIVPCKKLLVR
jgi:hypothetical protein